MVGDAMLNFNEGRGAWSCPNSMDQTLLTPYDSPYPLGGVYRRWARGERWGGVGGRVRGRTGWNVK